jgi:hypothetical protein
VVFWSDLFPPNGRYRGSTATVPLVVGNTHILYNDKRADIKLCQLQCLMQSLTQLCHDPTTVIPPQPNDQPSCEGGAAASRGEELREQESTNKRLANGQLKRALAVPAVWNLSAAPSPVELDWSTAAPSANCVAADHGDFVSARMSVPRAALILCGDFNVTPASPLLSFLLNGNMCLLGLDPKTADGSVPAHFARFTHHRKM